MWLLVISAFGFIVPNGFLIRWMVADYRGLTPIWADHLALGFIIDVLIATLLLAYWYARHPIGKVRWYWFVVLSFVGGLAFSLPLYWWLNERRSFGATSPA